ncbi:hypothetical protein [Mesonia sp. K7]|uniref:hypothetical protein n=1 Tax=Mesonia sp. K7 TaxID=2218606 RepID=UPI000DA6FE1E|nr:hypothetical protein [Mesonia sp. K7]PZD77935.1 hypothetical protein DNG35_07535 [Mesonia sp. K7]
MKRINLILVLSILFAFTACKNDTKKDENIDEAEQTDSLLQEEVKEEKIVLTKLSGSPAYAEASLAMNMPKDKVKAGEVDFDFAVNNYELGAQTQPKSPNGLAASDKGQHIHLIIDNEPYSAHYDPKFKKEMSEGDHVVLAFLSRSYHEAVKNANSYVVKKISVGNVTDANKMDFDPKGEHLFYSRPKGSYKGKDTEKVLLDFFLVNSNLAVDGNKVRAHINGQEFILDSWEPYVMENLPMGENTVRLELLDKDGNLVKGPFNAVTRTFMLEE